MHKLKIIKLFEESNENNQNKFINNIRSNLSVNTDMKKVETDFEWLDLMSDTIRYLDNILRNPNRFIINEEEIVKIELARKTTVESIRHLSKHTNFIQKIEDNGDVKPSKILNINKDESYDTYENRLIYTLIENMRNFVEIKKKSLITASSLKDIKKAKYSARSKLGKEQVFLEMNYTSSLIDKKDFGGDDLEKRIQRLEDDITMLCSTDVYRTLKKMHVARVIPPIKKTNVILKNTNFQYAMKLWDYLQNHVADDTKIIKSNKKYEDNGILKEYMNNTFLLDFLAMDTISESDNSKSSRKEVVEEITENLIQRIVELNADMPETQLNEKIADKIAIIKYRREASLMEIQNIFSTHIKNYLEKIENAKL